MKTYIICNHCGDRTFYAIEPSKSPQFCSNCRSAEQRKKVDLENEEIRKERGISS